MKGKSDSRRRTIGIALKQFKVTLHAQVLRRVLQSGGIHASAQAHKPRLPIAGSSTTKQNDENDLWIDVETSQILPNHHSNQPVLFELPQCNHQPKPNIMILLSRPPSWRPGITAVAVAVTAHTAASVLALLTVTSDLALMQALMVPAMLQVRLAVAPELQHHKYLRPCTCCSRPCSCHKESSCACSRLPWRS